MQTFALYLSAVKTAAFKEATTACIVVQHAQAVVYLRYIGLETENDLDTRLKCRTRLECQSILLRCDFLEVGQLTNYERV